MTRPQLITCQWYLDLDYCNTLISRAPKAGTASTQDLLHFLYNEKRTWKIPTHDHLRGCRALRIPESIPNIDAQFTDIKIRPGVADTYDATMLMRPGFNYLHVAQMKRNRLIIINGVHHAYALLQAGWKYIPCLVRKANNLEEIGFPPDQLGVMPEERVLNNRRPPYLSDFTDEEIAPRFKQYVVDQSILSLQPIPLFATKPPCP